MKRPLILWLAAAGVVATAAAAAGPALAQPDPGAVAVLYDQPNFHGHSVRIVGGEADLRRLAFNHAAMSGHFDGDWVVCDGPRFTGRCTTVTGIVANFIPLGLDHQIGSLRQGEAVRGAGVGAEAGDDGYYDHDGPPSRPPSREIETPLPEPGPAMAPPPVGASAADIPQDGVAGYGSVFFAHPQQGGADVTGHSMRPANAFCRAHGLGQAIYFDSDGHVLRDLLCLKR